MKQTSTLFIHFLIFFTLVTSCKKDGLTKPTQAGENTFSCKVNGVVFKPCENGGLFTGPALYGGVSVSTVAVARITAECNVAFPQKQVSIYLDNFHGVGEYDLSNVENNICEYNEFTPEKYYSSSYTMEGKVTITKDDRTNFILSGTFAFTAANKDNSNDTVVITDGRFDISYK